jgi:hypothetical protein
MPILSQIDEPIPQKAEKVPRQKKVKAVSAFRADVEAYVAHAICHTGKGFIVSLSGKALRIHAAMAARVALAQQFVAIVVPVEVNGVPDSDKAKIWCRPALPEDIAALAVKAGKRQARAAAKKLVPVVV